jgi:integrase
LVDSGELAPRSLEEYRGTTDLLVATFGARRLVDSLTAADFQELRGVFSKRYGVFRVGNSIQRVRTIFRFGYDAGLIDKPLRFGPGFKKPSAKAVREQRQAHGPRLFVPEELRAVLKHSTVNIKAMVLLGINGGLGNTDVAMLPLSAVDLTGGWLVYPRAKTAIGRKIPLWPETREAIRQALSERGEPKDPSEQDLVFIGRRGESYVCEHHGYRVHQEFARVLKKAGVANRTFYDLRRTFQTVSEGAHDLSATQAVMGHAAGSGDMSAIYRQSVDDDRLQAVVAHVRNWLFGTAGAHVDDVHHQASGKSAPPDAQLARAIDRARGAIAAATGPTRRTLESAWLAEIDNATRGDSEARRRLLEVWGQDDRDDRPRLRVVS